MCINVGRNVLISSKKSVCKVKNPIAPPMAVVTNYNNIVEICAGEILDMKNSYLDSIFFPTDDIRFKSF